MQGPAHLLCKGLDDLPVGTGLGNGLFGRPDLLEPPLEVRKRPGLLHPARGGQDHVGDPGRLGHKDILHHEEFQPVEKGLEVRVARRGIVAHDVEGGELPRLDAVYHLNGVHPGRLGQDGVPGLGKGSRGLGVRLLVPGIVVREHPHVEGALEVAPSHERIEGDVLELRSELPGPRIFLVRQEGRHDEGNAPRALEHLRRLLYRVAAGPRGHRLEQFREGDLGSIVVEDDGRDLVELIVPAVYEDQVPALFIDGADDLDARERVDLARVLVEHEDDLVTAHARQLARKERRVQSPRRLEPGKRVHVVRPDHGAHELLEHIVVFVRGPDRAEAADAVGPALVLDHLEVRGNDRERLVPRAVDELAADAHLRRGQPVGVVHGVPAEAALGAEIVLPGRAHPHDLAVPPFKGDGAAAAAVVADRRRPLEAPAPRLILELTRGERAHGADLHAFAAKFAVQRPVEVGADPRPRAAPREGPLSHGVLLVADAHALAAEDAAADVPLNDGALVVRREVSLLRIKPALAEAVLVHQVLEPAFACLVADGAVQGVFDEQELEDHPPRLDERRGAGPHHHVVDRRRGARRRELARRSLQLHEADPAGPEGMELIVVAEGRDAGARRLRGVEDRGPGFHFYGFSVNGNGDFHGFLP